MSLSSSLDPGSVAVVIPAFNEALRIREVVTAALGQCQHVIVVDDGSTDDTAERICDLPVVLLQHARRQGKGASLRDGFAEARRRAFDGVLTMDGDGQHRADDIPALLAAAAAWPEAIIIGARLQKRDRQPAYRRWANAFGDWGIGWACGQRISDTQSGQRFYPVAVLAVADLATEDFVYEADLLIEASSRFGTRCVSVPIESRYQHAGSHEQFRPSHFRPWRDLRRIVAHVARRIHRSGRALSLYRASRSAPALIHAGAGPRHTINATGASFS